MIARKFLFGRGVNYLVLQEPNRHLRMGPQEAIGF